MISGGCSLHVLPRERWSRTSPCQSQRFSDAVGRVIATGVAGPFACRTCTYGLSHEMWPSLLRTSFRYGGMVELILQPPTYDERSPRSLPY